MKAEIGVAARAQFRQALICFIPVVLATICARYESAGCARMHKLVAGLPTLHTFSIVCSDVSNARIGWT